MSNPLQITRLTAPQTLPLRHAVLWPDKPLDFCMLPEDASGTHLGAWRGGELVGVVSAFETPEGVRFRKLAVAPDCQGQGIGQALLAEVKAFAASIGARRVYCDARLTARGFYERSGFVVEGAAFMKQGLPYSVMSCALNAPLGTGTL